MARERIVQTVPYSVISALCLVIRKSAWLRNPLDCAA
ncbi:hypothetical protein T02_1481 [Trichinella nativa]|uniref:Uncharacterized protein n=1 Tax=Trichinella nativa TaxID=6335 RepID=A0A0V1KJE6_9BILA|nr:hypothetical protein T02_1481 [Trichinella nativa]